MPRRLERLVFAIIGHPNQFSLEERIFNAVSFATILENAIIIPFNYFARIGGIWQTLIVLFGMIIVTCLYYLARFRRIKFVKTWLLVVMIEISLSYFTNAGLTGFVPMFFIFPLIFSIILLQNKNQVVMVIFIILNMISLVAIEFLFPQYILLYPDRSTKFVDVVSSLILVFLLLSLIVRVVIDSFAQERAKSENLLLNILPSKLADEFREYGLTVPQCFDDVTLMYIDFASFTSIPSDEGPRALDDELGEIFAAFDRILADNRCTRVRTIGDNYMGVCGMPAPDPRHAENILCSAIGVINFLATRNKAAGTKWEIQVGIHTGSVNGVVVGDNVYVYDSAGDTVKIVSRLESNSLPMRINISESTASSVRDLFVLQERRPLFIKGRGEIRMYFVADGHQIYAPELSIGCKLLSPREAEIASLICQRLKTPQIAARLSISPRTVDTHIANIYEKLEVRSRRELIAKLLHTRDESRD